MNIGFTGTRNGMTQAQMVKVGVLLSKYLEYDGVPVFHNGLARGSDAEAFSIAKELGYYVLGYPSNMPSQTCNLIPDAYAQEPKAPLFRNPDIVKASQLMIATPSGFNLNGRGGTKATIRESIRQGVPIIIVYPDGTTERK